MLRTLLPLAEMTPAEFGTFVEQIQAGSVATYGAELVLIGTIALVLLADLFVDRERARSLMWAALAGVVGALVLVVRSFGQGTFEQFGRPSGGALVDPMLVETDFARFFQVVFLVGTAVTILYADASRELRGRPMAELYATLLAATLGCFVMSEANHLLMAFVGVELLSIPSYLLTGWIKRSRAGSEAALKYVVYGSVASGFMIYGFSLFYGMSGSLMLPDLAELFARQEGRHAVAVALLLAFAGFGYKLAAVPFHFWAPDVYQGAPTAITGWLSVASKAAGVALFVRFVDAAALTQSTALPYTQLIALIAAVTMTLGNLAALQQTDLKRMLAYSSVAHVGYILMGVAAFDPLAVGGGEGWKAVAFYSAAYLVMNLGAFGCVILAHNHLGNDRIKSYSGLGTRAPMLAISLTVFLVSLLGVPPTAGFSGKFQLFYAAINHGLTWLAVVAGLNTAISAGYYARVIKVLYFDAADDPRPIEAPLFAQGVVIAHMAAVLYLGICFDQLAGWAQRVVLS